MKDLIAYLRLAVHPGDEISFRRVVNYPTRGVGDATLHKLERHALAKPQPQRERRFERLHVALFHPQRQRERL